MAEPKQYMYSLREAAISLIKVHDLHEGYWALAIEFQLGATFAAPQGHAIMPTGMVSVSRIGLQESDPSYPHAVNAADVNPLNAEPSATNRPRAKRAKA